MQPEQEQGVHGAQEGRQHQGKERQQCAHCGSGLTRVQQQAEEQDENGIDAARQKCESS